MRDIKIGAFGDIMFGVCSSPEEKYNKLLPIRVKNGNLRLDQLNRFVSRNDINIANLESPISRNVSFKSGEKKIIGPIESVDILKSLKIKLVSLANNHSFDYGIDVLNETMDILRHSDISCMHSPQFNNMSRDFIIDGKKISIISYGAKPFYNFETDCLDPDYYKNWNFFTETIGNLSQGNKIDWLSRNNILPLIKEISKKRYSSDYTLVFIHWGFANTHLPSPLQVEIAHKLIELGVDAIIGHHPHVIQPVEKYLDRYIFYSLGNFIFDSWKLEKKRSLVLRLTLRNGKIIPAFHLCNRDHEYKFELNELELKNKSIKTNSGIVDFYYPSFLEQTVFCAEKRLRSYYKYSIYSRQCRSSNTLKTIEDLVKNDYKLLAKMSVFVNLLKSFK